MVSQGMKQSSQSVPGREAWPWEGRRPVESSDWPRISVVTPSYNQGKFIEETIRSVLLQDYPNLEYIIMDGGSKDETVEIIKKYEKHLTYWVSERDRGQSHAINKGITRCTGELFNWINSDDLLAPGALEKVAKAWRENPGSIVSGGVEFFGDPALCRREGASGQTLRNFVRFWEAEDFNWAQPATFVPLQDLKAVGGVREDLTYCMDYNMMVNLLLRDLRVTYVDATLARFRLHSHSKTVGAMEKFRLERVPMLRNMPGLPFPVADWEWDREQTKRLVDVARHAVERGDIRSGARLFGQALRCRPSTAIHETVRRAVRKLLR